MLLELNKQRLIFNPLMQIHILAFGITREICGARTFELELPDNSDTETLKEILFVRFPRLQALSSCLLAVNANYAHEPQILASGDEVALIPPVSGG